MWRLARETLALASSDFPSLVRLIDSDSPQPPRRRERVTLRTA